MKKETIGLITLRVIVVLPMALIGMILSPLLWILGTHNPWRKISDALDDLTFTNNK